MPAAHGMVRSPANAVGSKDHGICLYAASRAVPWPDSASSSYPESGETKVENLGKMRPRRTGRFWILICHDHRTRILGPVRAHERENFFFLLSIHLVSSFSLFSFSIFLFFLPFFLVCLGNALPLLDGSWYGKITEIQVRSMTV